MDMTFIEILQLNCYAVPELPLSQNPLHNCMSIGNLFNFNSILPKVNTDNIRQAMIVEIYPTYVAF